MLPRQQSHTARDRSALSQAVAGNAPQELIDALAARVAKRRHANMLHTHRSVVGDARGVLRDFAERPLGVTSDHYGRVVPA